MSVLHNVTNDTSAIGERPNIYGCWDFFRTEKKISLQKKRYKTLKSNASDYYRCSSESRRLNG